MGYPTVNMTLLTLKCFSKLFELDTEIDTGENGWRCYKILIGIRNKLTHPSTSGDLLIPDELLDQAYTGIEWFEQTIATLLSAYTEKYG